MSISLIIGASQEVSVSGQDQVGNPIGTGSVIWTTSDPTIATVSSVGLVTGHITGVATGTVSITATSGSVSTTITVVVYSPTLTTLAVA
jgi:uncharacterized protein YjdB